MDYQPSEKYKSLKILVIRTAVTLGIAYAALSMANLEKRCERVEYTAK